MAWNAQDQARREADRLSALFRASTRRKGLTPSPARPAPTQATRPAPPQAQQLRERGRRDAHAEIAELACACAAAGNTEVLDDFLDGRLSLAGAYRALELAGKPAAEATTLEGLRRAAARI